MDCKKCEIYLQNFVLPVHSRHLNSTMISFRDLFTTWHYRTFSLNFGVRAGTQEDYDWIEQQMYDGDDFQTFATALSWMTDTEASIPIIERVR